MQECDREPAPAGARGDMPGGAQGSLSGRRHRHCHQPQSGDRQVSPAHSRQRSCPSPKVEKE